MIAAKQTPTERHGGSDRAAPQRGGTDSAVERFHPYSAPCSIILNQPRRRHHPGNPCLSATPSVPVPCLGLHCTDCALSVPENYLPFVRLCRTYRTRCMPYRIRLASLHPAQHEPRRHGGTGVTAVAATSQTHRPGPRTTHRAQLPDATAETNIATETPRVPVDVLLPPWPASTRHRTSPPPPISYSRTLDPSVTRLAARLLKSAPRSFAAVETKEHAPGSLPGVPGLVKRLISPPMRGTRHKRYCPLPVPHRQHNTGPSALDLASPRPQHQGLDDGASRTPLMPGPCVGDDPLAFDKEPCVSGTAAASRMEPKIWVQWTRDCCV